jgi:hypothetical protein
LLVAAFLCGAILMAFEVIWAHFLAMFIVSRSVSLMLAAVLTAISVGGLLSAWWLKRRPNAFDYLPIIACAAACASLLAYETFNRLTSAPWAAEWHRIVWLKTRYWLTASLSDSTAAGGDGACSARSA